MAPVSPAPARSGGKQVVLGSYPTEVQAAIAYDDAARAAQTASNDAAGSAQSGTGGSIPPAPSAGSGAGSASGLGSGSCSGAAPTSGAATSEPPLPLNFDDDEEAQRQLDEIAVFEVI